tara:strand:+ start:674 stop:994 length:321 start_codon:yes stop_codon:yes gene_type:complete
MIITEKAVSKVKEMANQQGLEGYGLRLMVVGGGCSGFTYDMDLENQENDGDSVIEREGLKVYVDPMSYQYLDGTTVDYIESFKYSGFTFENPNATRTCGCGSSFAV